MQWRPLYNVLPQLPLHDTHGVLGSGIADSVDLQMSFGVCSVMEVASCGVVKKVWTTRLDFNTARAIQQVSRVWNSMFSCPKTIGSNVRNKLH